MSPTTPVFTNNSVTSWSPITFQFDSTTTDVVSFQNVVADMVFSVHSAGTAANTVVNAFRLDFPMSAGGMRTGGTAVAPARRPAPPRGFNRYLNASDLLQEFILFLGTQGVRQGEVLQIPIDLFIKWIIIKAAEQDNEEPNVVLQLPAPKRQPRCLGCGKFMPRQASVLMHGANCATRYFQRQAA